MRKKANRRLLSSLFTYGIVILAFALCQYLIGAGEMSRSMRGMLIPICCWIVMAVSLNLVVGFAGDLSLGHAGFMSIGAYVGAVTSAWLLARFQMENTLARLLLSMAVSGVAAGCLGALIGIPVLRLRGDYLAIVTLAFGEIIRNVLNCLYLSIEEGGVMHFGFLQPDLPGTMLVKGPTGAVGISRIATFEVGFGLVLFALFVVQNLVRSRSGRAIQAVRDNRIAAESMGVPVTKYRMMAFVTAAVLAGMAGALYGQSFASVTSAKFKFDQSINVLVFVVLGGVGSIPGSVIAAALLTILPEVLREFSQYRMLVYAIVLILVMLATNNPMLRSFFNRLAGRFRKGDASVEGGGAA